MNERYREEIPQWLRLLGAWRINRESVDFVWGYFAPRAGLEFVLNRGTYFDTRYALSFAIGWGKFMVYLPFRTRLEEGCDMPRYGFAVHDDTLWTYRGGNYEDGQCQNGWWAWHLPYFSWEFEGHWVLDKSQRWVKMTRGMSPYDFRGHSAHVEVHDFTYKLKDGTVQNRKATCTVERRKWYRKWLPFLTKESQTIDITFDDEVGERSGSWRGGVIGCGYDMLPEDTVETCLRRMEKERNL